MSKKPTRDSSVLKTKGTKPKLKKKILTPSITIMALSTILLLFLINGICITGEKLKDALIIFSSTSIILTTALFIISWTDKTKKDKAHEC